MIIKNQFALHPILFLHSINLWEISQLKIINYLNMKKCYLLLINHSRNLPQLVEDNDNFQIAQKILKSTHITILERRICF